MALGEFEGAGGPLVTTAVDAIIEARSAQAAFEGLTPNQLVETYWGLLGEMVVLAETNFTEGTPAIEDGQPARWHSELKATRLLSSHLVHMVDQRHPYEQPPRSHKLHVEAQARYSPKQLADSGFSFMGTTVSDLF